MNSTIRRLSLAAGALALAWLLAPVAAPPLYDGLGFPDEPYRYVIAPTDYRHTKPPTSAMAGQTLPAKPNDEAVLASAEQGPQVQVTVLATAIVAPSGASVAHLRADPVAPTTEPPDGQIWGNVYRLSASSDAGPATIKSSAAGFLTLRAPTGPPPSPIIEYNPGDGWRDLRTDRVGTDLYESSGSAAGDYAIVIPNTKFHDSGSSTPSAPAQTSSAVGDLLVVVGSVLAAVILAIVAIRLARARSRPPPTQP